MERAREVEERGGRREVGGEGWEERGGRRGREKEERWEMREEGGGRKEKGGEDANLRKPSLQH